MMIVTGAAGFIGSCLISRLNADNFNYIVAVDDFSNQQKNKNLVGKKIKEKVDRKAFFNWLDKNYESVEFIFHIGARTDTTEFDSEIFQELNVKYSQEIWQRCVRYQIPLIYASSAATYGFGEHGYMDNEDKIPLLQPLNPYGESKNEFDKWALMQEEKPFYWAGLKFFNVYGPNEYHKGRMASVIFHAFHQVQDTLQMRLFKSHHPLYKDGGQMRDFIFVIDVIEVIVFLMHLRKKSGIYNLGTGIARSFIDLARGLFSSLNVAENIDFIDTPVDIRDKYQYYTQADMGKLYNIGYTKPFATLEHGIGEYVTHYLLPQRHF